MSAPRDALAAIRGEMQSVPLSARRIAGLLDHPGCDRRQILDAAAVPLDELAALLDCPDGGQSPFAIARGIRFEQLVFDNGMAELIRLVREHFDLDLSAIRQVDLSSGQLVEAYGKADNSLRVSQTNQHLRSMLSGEPAGHVLMRHPMTTIQVGGVTAHLEADAFTFAAAGQLTTVEVKSFAAIDGLSDPSKTADALLQSAVYVASLQDTVEQLGYDPSVVSTRVLLILTRDFSLSAVGFVREIGPLVRRLRRQIARVPATAAIAAALPPGLALPAMPTAESDQADHLSARADAADTVSAMPRRFRDGCVTCPMFRFCRNEARIRGEVAIVGSSGTETCGDIETIPHALDLATGRRVPQSAAEHAVAEQLARAARVADRVPSLPEPAVGAL